MSDQLPEQVASDGTDYGRAYYDDYGNCDQTYDWSSPHWQNFFLGVAGKIIAATNPSRALDVGCAKGLLVQALCEQGVDAHGIDISEHAIATSDPAVRDRLSVGSATDVQGTWDLITWIEVAEHMSLTDSETAIDSICAATNRVILSSTPGHFGDPTHINVRQPAEWAASFAERGFFRRTDVDLSFLSPWAVLFERGTPAVRDVVHRYEQWAYPLRVEVLEKRAALLEATRRLEDPGPATPPPEDQPLVAELQEARHRLMTLRDAIVGAEAESASARREAAEAQQRAAAAEQRLADVEQELLRVAADRNQQAELIEAMWASTTWRVGKLMIRPFTMLRRDQSS